MIDWYLISVLIFIVLLAVIVFRDRKNFKRESILLLRKTKKGKGLLLKIGNRFPRGWKFVGMIGVAICFVVSVWGFYFLLQNLIDAFIVKKAVPGLLFVLPSPTTTASIGPGYFAVPFWYWIISLGLLVLVHEGSHGIMAVREKVPIKSLGWGLLAVIPLAFVEPNEKLLQKKGAWSQLRVFAAGSFANFILAGISILILFVLTINLFVPAGASYTALIKDYPAEDVNLTGVIIGIDNYTVKDAYDLSLALEKAGPNKTVIILTTNGTDDKTFTLTTAEPSETPEYKPDIYANILISLEPTFPGTIDFSKSFSKGFSSMLGAKDVVTWNSLQADIKFWTYIQDNCPQLSGEAEEKIENLNILLKDHPKPGFIGIGNVAAHGELKSGLKQFAEPLSFVQGLLFFLFLINFGVGLANLLPINPLDGGRMWYVVLEKLVPKHSKKMINILSALTLFLIIANFALPLIISHV
jgi:membrane-associated protease RseP (regulator of RpoE activity)